ncbi:MAG: hypothetical protein O2894_05670 [Planctomycetota bacterium]|nr:hypothetical protein [Planctomycetota bacterium]
MQSRAPSRSAAPPAPRRRLGAGRSGQVFEEFQADGSRLACKVFLPDRASSIVNTVLTGAVNPYRWDRHAVECAVLRRRILETLVAGWFAGRVRLPATDGACWNESARAFELRAELIAGRHAMLRHPLAGVAATETAELVREVLHPLQGHLEAAGFDGLLWQAGRGNPVAAANFMRAEEGDRARWVWIDAESGVPALFPLNPWYLLRTYLPLCVKHERPLFDDVDVPRLRAYVMESQKALTERLGERGVARLRADVDALEASQARWRSLPRHRRSVASYQATGKITREQARHYIDKPVRWLARLAGRACVRAPAKLWGVVRPWVAKLNPRHVAAALGRYGRFFLSQDVRTRWARRHVRRRVLDWRGRGFLDLNGVRAVRESMAGGNAAEYVADFGVHLAIKPAIKLMVWGLIPALKMMGVIDSWWLVGALAVYGGAIGRTVYTLGRTVQALIRGRPAPWIALAAGLLPIVGNAAYPLQLLAATHARDGLVARFLVHDILSGVGRRLPIWGGKDTLMEHWFNRLACLVTRA